MPYAFLNPDGSIKQVFAKPSPFMRLGEGERMVNYNPPPFDPETQLIEIVMPIEGLDTQFRVLDRDVAEVFPVLERRLSTAVQEMLDAKARSLGYDSMLSAVSYAGSSHPVYGQEGAALRDWRDACWSQLFQMINSAKAGSPMPTAQEAISAMPAMGNT